MVNCNFLFLILVLIFCLTTKQTIYKPFICPTNNCISIPKETCQVTGRNACCQEYYPKIYTYACQNSGKCFRYQIFIFVYPYCQCPINFDGNSCEKCSKGYTGNNCECFSNTVTLIGKKSEPAGDVDGNFNDAKLDRPHSIRFFNLTHGVLVSFGNHKIKMINLEDSTIHTIAGSTAGDQTGIGLNAKFNGPNSIKLSPNKKWACIADEFNHKIKKIDFETLQVTELFTIPNPGGCEITNSHIFASSLSYGIVRRYEIDSTNGVITNFTYESITNLGTPLNIHYLDVTGNIFIAERFSNKISVYNFPNFLYSFNNIGTPQDVTIFVDPLTNFQYQFWVSRYDGILYGRKNSEGVVKLTSVVSQGVNDGIIPDIAQLNQPVSIEIYPSFNGKLIYIYIADFASNIIKRAQVCLSNF